MKEFITGKTYVFVFKKYKKHINMLSAKNVQIEKRMYKAKSEAYGFKCSPWFNEANGFVFTFNKENASIAIVGEYYLHRKWCKEVK